MIAEKLGISQETVSHILSGGPRKDRYSEQTQALVLDVARELGYRPHRGAQLMRSGRSNLIGVIHFGSVYEVASHTARYLPSELKGRGYRALVIDLGWEGDNAQGAVDQLIEARVEGVIVTQQVQTFGQQEVGRLLKAGIPVITIAGNEQLGIPTVYSEITGAMSQLVEHLVGLGHRRLLLMTTSYNARPRLERDAGFRNGIECCGGEVVVLDDSETTIQEWLNAMGECPSGLHGAIVPLEEVVCHDVSLTAYVFARRLFAAGAVPDVFVCSNDLWARGVFSAALESGWAVPQKIAITGVDDDAFGAYPPYYLTTIAQSRQEECIRAVKILDEMIAGKMPVERVVALPSRVVIRHSCGAK